MEIRSFSWDSRVEGGLADLEQDERTEELFLLTTSWVLYQGTCLPTDRWWLSAFDRNGRQLWSCMSEELQTADGQLEIQFVGKDIHVVGINGERCCLDRNGNILWSADINSLRTAEPERPSRARYMLHTYYEIQGFSAAGRPCWQIDVRQELGNIWSWLPQPDGSVVILSTPMNDRYGRDDAGENLLRPGTMLRMFRLDNSGRLSRQLEFWPDYPFRQVGAVLDGNALAIFKQPWHNSWLDVHAESAPARLEYVPEPSAGKADCLQHGLGTGPLLQMERHAGSRYLLTDAIWKLDNDGILTCVLDYPAWGFGFDASGELLAAGPAYREVPLSPPEPGTFTGWDHLLPRHSLPLWARRIIEVHAVRADGSAAIYQVDSGAEHGDYYRLLEQNGGIIIAWEDRTDYGVHLSRLEP